MRYIQAAISDENHKVFRKFAFNNDLTLSDLIEVAVTEYINAEREEEDKDDEVAQESK